MRAAKANLFELAVALNQRRGDAIVLTGFSFTPCRRGCASARARLKPVTRPGSVI